jgi:hypothetical protein
VFLQETVHQQRVNTAAEIHIDRQLIVRHKCLSFSIQQINNGRHHLLPCQLGGFNWANGIKLGFGHCQVRMHSDPAIGPGSTLLRNKVGYAVANVYGKTAIAIGFYFQAIVLINQHTKVAGVDWLCLQHNVCQLGGQVKLIRIAFVHHLG